MADTKITALTALTAADPANDVIPIVDVSDTSMAASGTTKKISVNNILGASGTATLASATITGAATVGTTLGVTGVSTFAAGTAALPALTTTGDTNTGIYYPAADTFAVTTGGTERYRVDSSGHFGIGVSPVYPLQIKKDGVNSGAGWYIIGRLLNDAQTKGVDIGYNNTSNLATITAVSGGVSSGFEFWAFNGAWYKPVTVDTSGNLSLATGNVVMATSGKGIDFSATADGSGTMTSELLNDYEEGTFTPTVSGASSAGVGVYTVQYGRYTKIGRNVFVQVYLDWSAHTGTGSMRFTNLPFTSENVSNGYSSVAIGEISGIALTAGNYALASIPPNTSRVNLSQYPTGGGSITSVTIDPSGYIFFSASYQA